LVELRLQGIESPHVRKCRPGPGAPVTFLTD
jgi:hypothetical protein